MKKFWKTENDIMLKELALTKTREEVAQMIGFNEKTIRRYAKKLGIKFYKKPRSSWTEQEILLLETLVKEKNTFSEIAIIMDKEERSVFWQCSKFKIKSKIRKSWTAADDRLLIKIGTTEKPNREIARIMGFDEGTVGKKRRELGVVSKRVERSQEQRELKKIGKRRCLYCEEIKNVDDFYRLATYRYPSCKSCNYERSEQRHNMLAENNELDTILKAKLCTAKARAKGKCIDFDLTLDFLSNLFGGQNGKCFYSGQNMALCTRNSLCISIDRADSLKGYTQDNVVLCCKYINTMKSNFTTEEFIQSCKLISDKHVCNQP